MTTTFRDTIPTQDAANQPLWRHAAHAASEIDDDDPPRKPMTPGEALMALVVWMLSTIFVCSVVFIAWERLQ